MSWGRYVSAAEKRAKAARWAAKLSKSGRELQPVQISGRTIARTFWGKAWCQNLEAYSDYANRLPRGRTYTRNGSILDLRIEPGVVTAVVSGTRLYEVGLRIDALDPEMWQHIREACAGEIGSLVELLQGELSRSVMEKVTRPREGLFPQPSEIHLGCSCPDWASMCKHVAATLYGVGARLDHAPELLFTLRGVDPTELIEQAIDHGLPQGGKARRLEGDLSAIFGDIDFGEVEVEDLDLATDTALAPPTLLGLITAEPGLSARTLATRLARPLPKLRRQLAGLREVGRIEFRGSGRTGGYFPAG